MLAAGRTFWVVALAPFWALAWLNVVGRSDEPKLPGADEFFEKRVRPVLIERCLDCHSGEAPESGLRVDSRAALLQGGLRGPAIVPGDPQKSLLILAVNHADQLHMPPKSKAPQREIDDLTTWVAQGAVWPGATAQPAPRETSIGSAPTAPTTATSAELWSFQPPQLPPVPAVNNPAWLENPLDAFILSRQEEAGLTPAPPADRHTMIRRLWIDLLGAPPTPADVARFVEDPSPDAYARAVDRLLASPQYGERWGRHWLDVARYADSNGLDENLAYAHAFRYRDYVVESWNQDKPYSTFILEQLAGDLLPEAANRSPRTDRLVATGFLVLGAKMLAEDDPVKMQMDIIDEQVDTIGKTFMGLTLGCARCHDHKFDPISMRDYYALAGILKSTKTMENFQVVAKWQELPLASEEELHHRDQLQTQLAELAARQDQARRQAIEQILEEARAHVGDYLLAAAALNQQRAWAAQATPTMDAGAGLPPESLLLEAEDHQRGNVLCDRDHYGAGIGVLVNRGEQPNYVEFDIEAPHGGWWRLELRYAAEAARPVRLLVNQQPVSESLASQATGGWTPAHQKWFVGALLELSAGHNCLRLEQPTFFPHIDKLLLKPASSDETPRPVTHIDPQYQVLPNLTAQWDDYLQQPAHTSPGSVFQVWRQAVAQGSAVDLRELAMHYQQRFGAVRDRVAQQQAAGQPSSPLEDPLEETLRRVLYEAPGPLAAQTDWSPFFSADVRQHLLQLQQQEQEIQEQLPPLPTAMAVSDALGEDVRIHLRGSHLALGDVAPRGFPRALLGAEPPPVDAQHSGRLELAQWIADRAHPLTARVLVNRIWQWHFGTALVRSPDNFGRLGQPPTHPELLDYLAVRFQQSGWSIKALQGLIVNSATYRMSTRWDARAAEIDPENQLYWRMNRQRLSAEALRDSLLAMGQGLDTQMGGTLLPTENRKYVTSTANVNPELYQSRRRSLYLPVVRSALYEMFQAFDFPDPSVMQGQRAETTIAPQALFLMNSELVSEQSRAMARRFLEQRRLSESARIEAAVAAAWSRPADTDEIEACRRFLRRHVRAQRVAGASATEAWSSAWQSLCRALLSSHTFVYVD